jgi:type I restriction enzyme R subunit
MVQHNEIEVEKELTEHLAAHGWLYSPNDDGCDRPTYSPTTSSAGSPTNEPEEIRKAFEP